MLNECNNNNTLKMIAVTDRIINDKAEYYSAEILKSSAIFRNKFNRNRIVAGQQSAWHIYAPRSLFVYLDQEPTLLFSFFQIEALRLAGGRWAW